MTSAVVHSTSLNLRATDESPWNQPVVFTRVKGILETSRIFVLRVCLLQHARTTYVYIAGLSSTTV